MKETLQILCLEDSPHDVELLRQRLEADGIAVDLTVVETRQNFLRAVEEGPFDLILSDYTIPGFGGREALILAKEKCPDVPFVFFSGTIGQERAVECVKIGATDFVLKDHPSRLIPAIQRALDEAAERERRREAERDLRTAEAQFRALVEQSIVGVYIVQEGRFTYVNPVFAELLGRSAEELTTRPLWDFIAPEDRAQVEHNIQKRLEGSVSSIRYQLRMLHKTGAVVDVEVHGSNTEINGQPAILGVLMDITERKRAEVQIREQATLLDKALNAILVHDLSGRIRYWNEGAARLYGWSAAEAVGQNADALLFSAEASKPAEAHKEVIGRGEWSGELQQVTKEGKSVTVESHWSLIRDDNNEPKSILKVNIDITAKKKADAEMRRAQRLDSIGSLAGGIAHDLNNALGPILMSLTILRGKVPDDSGQKVVEILETSARRAADMVKQILLFARGVEGERVVVPLNHLLADLTKILKQTFPKTIEVKRMVAGDLWPVVGDHTQLHQVFMNLCVNARDAMPKGGLLRIEASNTVLDELQARMYAEGKAGSYVLITVSDSGSGIPPEIMEKIFEPFFTTKEIGKGTGLGLSTVVGIVRSHGGFVKAYSEVGRGTSFRVYLPAAEATQARQSGAKSAEAPRGRGQRILAVDDEAALREITKSALERNGYQVTVASDGAEAIAIYAQQKTGFHAVITDMTMPVMDGPATIRALKRINPNVRIIAVSGLMADLKASQIEDASNVQFLAKPYDTEKLLWALHKLFEGVSKS